MKEVFKNANDAFVYYYDFISRHGSDFQNTKALFNIGIHIENPLDNNITAKFRKWNFDYANSEWMWYLSGDKSLRTLEDVYGKIPSIWKKMADENNEVMSNYGWHWYRNSQLMKVADMLKEDPTTRKASISIYDGKEIDDYALDTPCTYAINFTIINNKLNMTVMMRSNDLWFGFCNDQYCFSMLQEMMADYLQIDVGWYYHFVNNLHVYDYQLNK